MIKKILIYFGIFLAGIVVSLIVGGLILTSLSGSSSKVQYSEDIKSKLGAPISSIKPAGRTEEISLVGAGETGTISSESTSRLVIKTGTINMVVKDIAGSAKNIIKYAEDKGGWVVTSSVSEREKLPSGYITVRVPAEFFEEAVAYFRGLAVKVTFESTGGEDVTEEYVDLQSRLRNLEASEAQLLKIMERAGKISEVLEVQRELTNVRSQIEQTKGRIQYLERSAQMASITINLALSEELLPIPPGEKWRPKYVLLRSWKSVLVFWRGFSYFLINIVVWAQVWVPLVIIIWLVRRFWKKRKLKALA